MSLESCIRKAGKALTREDAEAIKALRDDIYGAGDVSRDAANEQAVTEYLEILEGERQTIMNQVEAAGGFLADPGLSPSEFSQRVETNLEEAARRFPQRGVVRPPAETELIDMKTGTQLPPQFARARDPNVVTDLLTERTEKTVEWLYPDFYDLDADQVVRIVNQFDPTAALGLAKQFKLVPPQTRSIDTAQFNQKRIGEIRKRVEFREEDSLHGWAARIVADWVQKNENLPLYYKVEDLFERDMVDAHPDNPLSVTIKYAQTVQEAEEATAGPIRSLVNKMVDAGEIGKEAILAAVPQSKLKDFVKSSLEHIRGYTDTVKRMDAWMNKVIERDHTLAKRWLAFNQAFTDGAKLLGEFMHASTLAGVDVPSFQMPDQATWKKMNKKVRAMWLDRQRDAKILQPFWDKLGAMGEPTTYQTQTYDPRTDKMVPTGEPIEVSEGQAIYMMVRDSYMNQRNALIYNLEQRINESEADANAKAELIARLRRQFEAGLINPYFPLSRFGKYQAVAKTKEGEVVAFIKRESRRERNQWIKEMRGKGFVAVPFEEQATDLDQMNKIDPGFVAKVTGLLKDTTVTDQEGTAIAGSSIADEIWQMYLRTLPELSARKAYIHRIGRLGFTHDALRAFSDHSFHGAHQTAKLRFGTELSEHLKLNEEAATLLMQRGDIIRNWIVGARPEGFEDASLHELLFARVLDYQRIYSQEKRKAGVSGPQMHQESHEKALAEILREADVDGPWAIPLSNELKRRHIYNMNPQSAPWSTKMTALGFFWFLSTSPAAGVLNLTQTAISAYPILRARFQGAGAGRELLKASGEYAGTQWVGMRPSAVESFIERLKDADEQRAMREFSEIGMFSKTRTRELMGLSEAGTAYSQKQEQYLEMAGYIFHKTEEMNRAVTALAAYRLARKAGRRHDLAVAEAEELVEMSHYDYTNTNRPRFMQGDMGRVVFLFRNYSLNMFYRLIRDFRDWRNTRDLTPEQRVEARKRFLGIIGMTTVFAGVSGWPLFWVAEAAANAILGDDDEPYDAKTAMRRYIFEGTSEYLGEVWGQRIATSVMKGPWSAFTGGDLSQRASLNNLWIREIPENLKRDPEGLMMHLAGEMMGPLWGMGMNIAAGFGDLGAGHPDRALEKFTPKFMGDIMKSLRYATQGAQTYQRDMIVGPEEFTSRDLFLQAAGFTPTRLADRYEQNRAIKDMEVRLRNRRQDLMNRLFMAWRVGDRGAARDAMQNILAWNRANPMYPISPDGIIQSARSRAQYDMRTVGGVAVERRLQYLQEQQRFTARPGQ